MKHGIRSWVAATDGFKSKEVQDSTDAEQSEKGLQSIVDTLHLGSPYLERCPILEKRFNDRRPAFTLSKKGKGDGLKRPAMKKKQHERNL